MQNAAILDITACADRYRVDITADGNQGPNADVISQINVADHYAGRIDHDALANLRGVMQIRTH